MSIKSDKWIRSMCRPEGRTRTAVMHDGKFAFWLDSIQGERWKNMRRRESDSKWDTKTYEYGPMISPFLEQQLRHDKDGNKLISAGVSSYGYDVRCGNKFKVFTNINTTVVDPKNFDPNNFVEVDADEHDGVCIIPPNSFALANTMEWMEIPRNVLVVCLGKSTYARCGIIVNVTPLEPEWKGSVTLEFSNTTTLPAKIYAGEGVAQMLFFESDEECETSYADRAGKYMGQAAEPTVPRL
jgi:dCTP deaminase